MGNDTSITQSHRGRGGKGKAHKTKAPDYTPEQRAFLRTVCLAGALVERVQEQFNTKFPENKKEIWDIRKERTKATQGKSILKVKREAAANSDVGDGKSLAPFVQRMIKMEEARARIRIKKKALEARQNGLYVPKTPPRVEKCMKDRSDSLDAILQELGMDSEDDYELMELAFEAENNENHDKREMSSNRVLEGDTA
ncbi:hypothetical protein MMC26_001705 [Xylographa opegraphella]|nr:hypothetical protein [Xylographa opegraphella]